MKSLRRTGCWTTFILIFALGAFIFLVTQSGQGRNDAGVSHVQGNVTMFGGDVRIGEDEQVMGNLLVVGDDLTLEGRIGGNLVVVGGDVDLTGHAQVGGNVSVVGGDADIEGSSVIGGNVAAVGGDVELAGHARVGGSVRVVGGRIEQDPAVHVGGEVAETARNQAKLHREAVLEAAAVARDQAKLQREAAAEAAETARDQAKLHREAVLEAAAVARDQAKLQREAAAEAAEVARDQAKLHREAALQAAAAASAQAASSRTPWFLVFLGKLVQAFLWTLLITALVLLFNWLLPKQVKAVSKTAEKETALSFATGAIGIVGSAILTAILTITICFALLALPLLALLALVVLCGWTVTCYWLGRRLDELVAGPGGLSWNPMISVGLSSLVITGVTAFSWVIFPCLGFIVALLIGSTGTGAAVVHVARGSGRLPGGVLGSRPDGPEPDGEEAAAGSGAGSAAQSPGLSEPGDEAAGVQDDEQNKAGEVERPPADEEQGTVTSPGEDSTSQDEPDDLTRVPGIGQVFSRRLQDAGIDRFSQLAALEVQEIAEILGCPASRVERERLREKAGELADRR